MSVLGNISADNAPGQGGSGGVMPDQDTSTAFQQGGNGQPLQVGITQAAPAPPQQAAPAPPQQPAAPAAPQPKSRLQAIQGAVANVVTTGLSGVPDRGRPSFVTGLGEGARAEQAAQAYQNDIKFRSVDSMARLANLHRQDLAQQQQSDELKAAQQAAQDFQKEAFDTPNDLRSFNCLCVKASPLTLWPSSTSLPAFDPNSVKSTQDGCERPE